MSKLLEVDAVDVVFSSGFAGREQKRALSNLSMTVGGDNPGITAIVGVIIDYVKLNDARGTWLENHLRWQIRTFWWGLFWSVIGFGLIWVFGLGFVVLGIVYIWTIYRVVKGWLKLTERKQVHPSL